VRGQRRPLSGGSLSPHARCGVTLATGQLLDVPTSNVMPANPPMLEGVEDLTQLSYLNEPSILHDLDYRFKQVCARAPLSRATLVRQLRARALVSVFSELPPQRLKSGGVFGWRG